MPTPPYVSELHQQHQIVIKRQSRVYSMGLPKGRTEEVCVKHAAHSLSPRKHLTLAIFIILGAYSFEAPSQLSFQQLQAWIVKEAGFS